MKKRIVLCADDYGQALAISQGIINLIQNKRLSATSCMVNTVYWPQHAKWLSTFRSQIDIGLHFNLTEGQPLSQKYIEKYGNQFPTLPRLLFKTFTRQLSQSILEAECHAQIDKFQQETGFLPDYIDGHQHSHQFPIIRDALITVYKSRLQAQNAYVRLVNVSLTPLEWMNSLKKIIIYVTGTASMKSLLKKNKVPFNSSFAGIYAFSESQNYPQLFKNFLETISDKGLIMCHPGLADSENSDPISDARFAEYQYLMSSQFEADCLNSKVEVGRFSG